MYAVWWVFISFISRAHLWDVYILYTKWLRLEFAAKWQPWTCCGSVSRQVHLSSIACYVRSSSSLSNHYTTLQGEATDRAENSKWTGVEKVTAVRAGVSLGDKSRHSQDCSSSIKSPAARHSGHCEGVGLCMGAVLTVFVWERVIWDPL